MIRRFALTRRDRAALRRRGLTPADAARQRERLIRPGAPLRLDRPCRVGDGIERWSPARRRALERLARAGARRGLFSVLVPASGAASRLFQNLETLRRRRDATGRPVASLVREKAFSESRVFFKHLDRLALAGRLDAACRRRGASRQRLLTAGRWDEVLDALFESGTASLPKGLVPFHGRGPGARTAFEEHLRAAATIVGDDRGRCRMHFTVAPDQRRAFAREARALQRKWGKRLGVRWRIQWSVQSPTTDTLALEKDGGWAREESGDLYFRPGGHGALLGNLEKTRAPFVFIRNIDNVSDAPTDPAAAAWRRALGGRLMDLWEEGRRWIRVLEAGGPMEGAAAFVASTLGGRPPSKNPRSWLGRILRRPWRVCGMIAQRGDPGGGPFWVRASSRSEGGPSKQIVEESQVGAGQRRLWRRSTHFNPVDMVVALRDHRRRPYRLADFADDRSVLVMEKMFRGRPVRVWERPGLWNGGMHRWNTVFVEIPAALFTPVKRVTDLLRPGHRRAH